MDRPKKLKPVTEIKVWTRNRTEPIAYSRIGLRANVQAGVLLLSTAGGSYDGKAVASFAAGQWVRMEVLTEEPHGHDPQGCPSCIADGSAEMQRRNGS